MIPADRSEYHGFRCELHWNEQGARFCAEAADVLGKDTRGLLNIDRRKKKPVG